MDSWADKLKDGSSNPYSFLTTNWSLLKWQALQTVPPRLALTGFTYAQTFLITAAINYLELPSQLRDINHAYGLIGATALIYCGIAVNETLLIFQLPKKAD